MRLASVVFVVMILVVVAVVVLVVILVMTVSTVTLGDIRERDISFARSSFLLRF